MTNSTGTENGNGRAGKATVEPHFDAERDSNSSESRLNFTQINAAHSDSAIDGAAHYQRVGFFCAITDLPKEALADEKKKLLQVSNTKVRHLTDQHADDAERFNTKLYELEMKLEQEEAALLELEGDLPSLISERDDLLSDLEALRNDLQIKLQELGDKKSKLIEERQKELVNELNGLIDQLEEINEKRSKINQAIFDKNENVLKKKVELFQRFSDEYEKMYTAALEFSKRLNSSGINSTVANFLVYVGYTCSIAAGWFFSIFALKNQLNNDTTPFAIIQAFFGFGDNFLRISDSPMLSAVAFIGVVLILLALQGAIAWLCQKIIDKKIKKKTDNFDFALNYQNDSGLNLKTKINAENSFIFWLKYIPWFFVGSIVFIMLALGGISAKLPSLDTSLTGIFIGSTIALLCSGIVFIYLTKVIEPRHENTEDKKAFRNLWANFELSIVVLLFLAAIVYILIGVNQPLIPQGSVQEGLKGVISLIEFTVATLLTAFTLGYGLRYKGIENTVNELEFKLKQFQDAIRENSRPVQLNLGAKENKEFNERFLSLRQQIFDMISAKNELAKTMLGNQPAESQSGDEDESLNDLAKKISAMLANPYAAPLRFLFVLKPLLTKIHARIRRFLSVKRPVASIMAEDEKYFPEFKHTVDDLRARILETQERTQELEDKISGIKEKNDDYYKRIVADKEKIEEQIDGLRRELSKRLRDYNHNITSENAKRDYLMLKLLEGFELGGWYGQQTPNRPSLPFVELDFD